MFRYPLKTVFGLAAYCSYFKKMNGRSLKVLKNINNYIKCFKTFLIIKIEKEGF